MLNNVSGLVNLKNAKKLAQGGAAHMETIERMPNSPELIHQSVSDGNGINEASESSQGQWFQTTCEAGFISNKSPRAYQELSSGTGPRKMTKKKMKAGASEDPQTPILGTNELPKVDSCSSARSLDAVGSDGFYLEAKVNGEKMVFSIDTGATKTIISERDYKSISSANRP